MEFDLENPLSPAPLADDDEEQSEHVEVESLFVSESDHMPSKDCIRTFKSKDSNHNTTTSTVVLLRSEAISMILQAKSSFDFDPFTSYLAVNYLDRFVFREGMLDFFDRKGKKPWILRLITDSCVSLAMKMMKIDFSITDFQRDDEAEATFILDSRTLHRSELLILGALNWRMRSVTPFAFTRYFISMLELEDLSLKQALSARTKDIIFKSQNEIDFLEFKPSIIAASSVLQASKEMLLPSQCTSFNTTISSCAHVNNQQLKECCDVMNKYHLVEHNKLVVVTTSETPKNVLDRHGWSSTEGERITTDESKSKSNANEEEEDKNEEKKLVEKGS